MEILNGIVFTDEGKFSSQPVYTDGEYISSHPSGETLDVKGLYVLPGLVDIHIHGYAGTDFCDGNPDGLAPYGRTARLPGSNKFSRHHDGFWPQRTFLRC